MKKYLKRTHNSFLYFLKMRSKITISVDTEIDVGHMSCSIFIVDHGNFYPSNILCVLLRIHNTA